MLAVNKLVDNKIESVCLKTIILRELIIVLAYLSTICILYLYSRFYSYYRSKCMALNKIWRIVSEFQFLLRQITSSV
jgi:hypothetical protein